MAQSPEVAMRPIPDPLRLLERGVPVTLLVDLLDPRGPDSARIYAVEGADTAWVRRLPRAS
jgi:hypothetical protein